MGDTTEPSATVTALGVIDMAKLNEILQEGMGDHVKCVVQLDPKGPTIAFSFPDCGSEEMGCKTRHLGAVMGMVVDQVFRWTTDNYDGVEDDDHDPSIA